MGMMDIHPQPCIHHFVDMLPSYISSESFILSVSSRSGCQKNGVYRNRKIKLFPIAHSLCFCIVWHLGILLVNLVQHSNPRTVTPLDEVKKSSLCAQSMAGGKIIQKAHVLHGSGVIPPTAHDDGGLRQVSNSTHQPPKPLSLPQLERSLFFFRLQGGEGQIKHIYIFFQSKVMESILLKTSPVYFASLGLERQSYLK